MSDCGAYTRDAGRELSQVQQHVASMQVTVAGVSTCAPTCANMFSRDVCLESHAPSSPDTFITVWMCFDLGNVIHLS